MNPWQLCHRFWCKREVDTNRLTLFRIWFYSLLALELWLRIGGTATYGADGFNVCHFAWMDPWLPLPAGHIMLIGWLFQSFLALRIALSSPPRWMPWLLAIQYAAFYFCSRIDSFQHHYLLSLLLIILAFIRVDKPAARSWPIRLVLIQLSIVYVWAAVAKMNGQWLSGATLAQHAAGHPLEGFQTWISHRLGTSAKPV